MNSKEKEEMKTLMSLQIRQISELSNNSFFQYDHNDECLVDLDPQEF